MKIFIAMVLILLCNTAFSFGAKGHRVAGEIAEQYLTPGAQSAVSEILEGQNIATASTWADEMRSSKTNADFWGYDYSANWHFVNIAKDKTYDNSQASKLGDAYSALMTFTALLKDEALPEGPVTAGLEYYFGNLDSTRNEAKAFALRFLIHLVVDIHQPLHVGYAEDQGGNQIPVKWFGENTNLHTVWDTRLVEYQGLSYTELSKKQLDLIKVLSPSQISAIENTTILDWLNEGLLLRETVYDVEAFNSDFNNDYTFTYVPLVESQLQKAGLRLAALLNSIF